MEKYYLAALQAAFYAANAKLTEIIAFFGSAEAAYKAPEAQWLEYAAKNKTVLRFLAKRDYDYPQKLADFCYRNAINLVCINDDVYPYRLRYIAAPPAVLYVKGALPSCERSIGIVGSRNASAYGLKAAETFAHDLSAAGIVVVSGGAKGVDAAAHKGALDAGGYTVAVLGCGVDIAYPYENRALFRSIAAQGAIISELAPGTPPLAYNFPARNRIINGITHGILVAEAAKKSGAMITAEFALDEGHEVYCVPGSIFQTGSIGCHSLIKAGARLVDRPEDILDDMQLSKSNIKVDTQMSLFSFEEYSDIKKQLLAIIGVGPVKLEELLEKTGITLAQASTELLELEMDGIIAQSREQGYYLL